MSDVAVEVRARRERTLLDRALALFPVFGIALAVLTFYGVEAWAKKTPWIFTDELEWSQLSRAIASTGHAARRGESFHFKSLYTYLIAPVWWIHSTTTAYTVLKYLNVVVMTLASVPTYLLARRLVSRRAAVVVALLSICIPAMVYATSIIPEVLAYPYYAASSYVIVRALATRSKRWIAGAVAISVGALLVRNQLMTVGGSLALAAGFLWLAGPRWKQRRAGWERSDYVGAVVLAAGAFFLLNRVFGNHVAQWQISTQYWKARMVDYGLTAASAFTIGLGILPTVGGLSALWLRDKQRDPWHRAFTAYLAGSIVALGMYTAVKTAYLSTTFATLTEERNLIYLSPLLLIGTALCFESRRVNPFVVAAAAAFALYIVLAKPYQLAYPYFEAPGYGILTMANRSWYWDTHDLHVALTVTWAVTTAVLLSHALRPHWRGLQPLVGVVALAVAAWMLTAEITSARGDDRQADALVAHLPQPVNWVDEATGGSHVTYLGQGIKDANGIWLTEFWNRSVQHVYSLDGTAPGPGPSLSPNVLTDTGLLSNFTGDHYVLADQGVDLAAPVVDRRGQLRLYRVEHSWRLRQSVQGIFPDGWAGNFAGFTYFAPGGPGTLHVVLSRTAYCGGAPAGRATVLIGSVRVEPASNQILFRRVAETRHVLVRNCHANALDVHVPSTPVRVEVHLTKTLPQTPNDQRNLGAQVSFSFARA